MIGNNSCLSDRNLLSCSQKSLIISVPRSVIPMPSE